MEPVEWSLEPVPVGDGLAWSIPELGETLSSADLAEKIAIRLSEYYMEYEQSYGRWPAA